MISFDNYVMLYESTLDNCQAMNKLLEGLDFNSKHSSLFNAYENMGWFYGCLFVYTDKEIAAFERDFWDTIDFFISNPSLSEKERRAVYLKEYVALLDKYGNEEDWEREKQEGNISIEEKNN